MTTRPLIGEPLAVDLLNTRWRVAGDDVDLLATMSGFAQWLGESGLGDLAATEAARAAVCRARAAIEGMVAVDGTGVGDDAADGDAADGDAADGDAAGNGIGDGVSPETSAESAMNGILSRGLTVRAITGGIVREHTIVTGPEWTAAWRAAANYLELRMQAPDGIRQCRHPDCVLYFFDPTGRRRWCSMAACGNRAKARRHYHRTADRARGDAVDALRLD